MLGTPPSTPNTGTPSELPTTSSVNTGTGTTVPSDCQAGTSSDSSERPAGPQNMFGGKLKWHTIKIEHFTHNFGTSLVSKLPVKC